jgi:hypothetical protein
MTGTPDYTWKVLAEMFGKFIAPIKHSWLNIQWNDVGEFIALKGLQTLKLKGTL